MTNTDLIKELRALTQAGMKDCKEALQEADWDLQKAVDIVKVKGLNIADGRTGRVAADGLVKVCSFNDKPNLVAMVEVNCQTDFVANSAEFRQFVGNMALGILWDVRDGKTFDVSSVESDRQAIVALTKENIVIRRWWVEESLNPAVKVFSYTHSNSKIAVLLTLQAPSVEAVNDPAFFALGEDLAMQIAAMNPLAVDPERIPSDAMDRQMTIFKTQLQEENKPKAMQSKILMGKMRKWNTEVCLLEQESVVVPKTSVRQVIDNVGAKLGGEITVVNFIRCQVGEGIEKKQDNLAEEVAKMM
jgi:elongation factor Ts